MTTRKLYVSAERSGTRCLGGTVEPCPTCGKNAVRVSTRGGSFVFVHTVKVSFDPAGIPALTETVSACESRIHRPGLVAPPPGLALPREIHAAQRRG